jgi:PAS domain S-box-containing protein
MPGLVWQNGGNRSWGGKRMQLEWYIFASAFIALFVGLGWSFWHIQTLRQKLSKLKQTLKGQQDQLKSAAEKSNKSETGSIQTTTRLRKYLRLLDTLINTIPNPIFFKDENGVFQGCNEAFSGQILGNIRNDIIGKKRQDLPSTVPSALVSFFRRAELSSRHQEESHTFEVEVLCTDGREKEFLVSIANVSDDKDQFLGSVAVMQDLTEKNKAARERLEKEKLEGVLETAGAVCHEMNQPLQAICGYTGLLNTRLDENDPSFSYITKINTQTDRIAAITRKLQNITRYEALEYADGSTIIDIHKASQIGAGTPSKK